MQPNNPLDPLTSGRRDTQPAPMLPVSHVDEAVRRGLRIRRFVHSTRADVEADHGDLAYDVAVVGLGDQSLLMVLDLVEAGLRVVGVDLSRERLDRIAAARVPIGRDAQRRLRDVLVDPGLSLTPESRAIAHAGVVVICVPPTVDPHGQPDLGPLRAACGDVVRLARAGQLIVLAVPAYSGATEELLAQPLRDVGFDVGADLNVAYSPTRADLTAPRLVAGVTPACLRRAQLMLGVLASSLRALSSPAAAEVACLAETTFRAAASATANEVARVCNVLGVDAGEVIDAARAPVGSNSFVPGPGLGGPDLPAEPGYLAWQAARHRLRLPVIDAAIAGVAERPLYVVARVQLVLASAGIALRGARVLVLGLASEANGADARQSPAVEIVSLLVELGAEVTVSDPRVAEIELLDGRLLLGVGAADLQVGGFDLVLVHTWHDDEDYQRLEQAPRVLDATYRLGDHPNRVCL